MTRDAYIYMCALTDYTDRILRLLRSRMVVSAARSDTSHRNETDGPTGTKFLYISRVRFTGLTHSDSSNVDVWFRRFATVFLS